MGTFVSCYKVLLSGTFLRRSFKINLWIYTHNILLQKVFVCKLNYKYFKEYNKVSDNFDNNKLVYKYFLSFFMNKTG